MAYNLYILMRTDMDSLNPGKAMAQAAHAANDAVARLSTTVDGRTMLEQWRSECDSFGTTLVFAVDDVEELRAVTRQFKWYDQVLDTTYPIRDGKVTHYLPIFTCGWVFCDEQEWKNNELAQTLSLHP